MHSQKFRNGTKKWRKQHRKFHPNNLIFWKPSGMKWSDIKFCQKLANEIEVNPGYILTADELKSLIVIDTDNGTKGRHILHEFNSMTIKLLED